MKNKHLVLPLATFSLSLPVQAAVVAQSFDFGSDPGKDGAGGFTTTPSAAWGTQADSLRYTRNNDTGGGNQNAFALRQFTSLGGQDFTVTSEATLINQGASTAGNADRFGLALFSPTSPGSGDGINLILRNIGRPRTGTPQTDGPLIGIYNGVNGSSLASQQWLGSVAAGTRYTFTSDVVYSGANFDVTFTLSDGTVSQDVTSTFAAASFTNDNFGFGSRTTSGLIVNYDTFAVAAIPEPTSALLLLGGLGALALRRRR